MLRFAANLSLLWTEISPLDRPNAAAAAGFDRAELLFPHLLDAVQLKTSLDQSGIELVMFDAHPGRLASGELGLMCLPDREAEFRESIAHGLELASLLGVHLMNVLAGV